MSAPRVDEAKSAITPHDSIHAVFFIGAFLDLYYALGLPMSLSSRTSASLRARLNSPNSSNEPLRLRFKTGVASEPLLTFQLPSSAAPIRKGGSNFSAWRETGSP